MSRLRLPLVPARLRWALVGAAALTVLCFSVVPLPGTGPLATGPLGLLPLSLWAHALGYAGLAVLLAYALHTSPRPDWQVLLVVFLAATGYGIGMELVQLTVPGRTFDVADVLVNAAAAALAVVGWRLLVRRVRFYRARHLADVRSPVE